MSNKPDGFYYQQLSLQVRAQIEHVLKEQGLTRAELAERLNVSEGRMSRVMSGVETLNLRALVTIAARLDCQVEMRLVPKAMTVEGG